MPERRRIAIVLSRLPRLIDPQAMWLCGLRAALRRIQESGDLVVIADGTAGSDFVRREPSDYGSQSKKLHSMPNREMHRPMKRARFLCKIKRC
ncbi:MAG TPA: hypothetical protein VGM98_14055 [Schlesneria sp.]